MLRIARAALTEFARSGSRIDGQNVEYGEIPSVWKFEYGLIGGELMVVTLDKNSFLNNRMNIKDLENGLKTLLEEAGVICWTDDAGWKKWKVKKMPRDNNAWGLIFIVCEPA